MKLHSGMLWHIAALLGCLLVGLTAWGGTQANSGTFVTSGQSIWASGPSFTYNYYNSIGTSFSANPSIGGISCDPIFGDCYGAEAGLSLSGSLGLNIGAHIDSGTVNASIPFNSTLTYPNIVAPHASFTPGAIIGLGSSSFMTTGPTAGAYTDLYGSFNASGYAEACFVACASTSGTIVNKSFTQELLAMNRNNDGQFRVLGQNVPLSGSYGPVSFTFNPALNGASASGFGTISGGAQTNVAHAGMDLAQAITDSTGIPLSGSIGGVINWSLISASLTLDTYFNQNFSLTPNVFLDLHVQQTGQDDLCFMGVGCGALQGPAAGQTLTIIPRYFANGQFGNDTGFQLAPGYDVSILSASFSLCCNQTLGSIGPLADWNNSFPLPEISVYDNTFNLQGFQEIDGQPFNVTATPEPASLVLLGTALLATTGVLRRRMAKRG